MPRNPELDKLLREVDSLTSSTPQVEQQQQVEESSQPALAKKGSSFLDAVGGFFISKVDDDESPLQIDTPPLSPHKVSTVAEAIPAMQFTPSNVDDLSSLSFADIYREAGVNESTFTVDKLAQLLQDPSLKDQPLSTKTLVLKMALKAQNVEPTVPVTDAIHRDRSLDAYQKMLNERAKSTESMNSQAVQQINDEVKSYLEQKNAEMDKLRAEIQKIKTQAEVFAIRRQEEERRLAEIIVPLLEGQPNPVNIGNNVG
jgi:hypothetical protein